MAAFSGFEHIVREQEPLAPMTWFRVGGAAEYFAEPTEVGQLSDLLKHCQQESIPVRVLGAGSRVLIPDDGVKGLVLQLSAPCFTTISVTGNELTAGGGAKLGHVISTAVGAGLAGLEGLVGVPGTVSGALRGNASSHGVSVGQWATRVALMNTSGETTVRENESLRFSHGESNLDELVILDATFKLESGEVDELTRKLQKAWIVKRAKQPTENLGVGRVFKDVQGMSAADVLEQAGVRGQSVGGARVSDVCANFVVVESGATSAQLHELIELMRDKAKSSLGIDLQYELEIW